MKKNAFYLLIYFFSLCLPCSVLAQKDTIQAQFAKPQLFVTFNFLRLFSHLSENNSTIFNPEIKLRVAEKVFVNAEVGFTDYKTEGDKRNFTYYQNKGYYIKAGLDFARGKDVLKFRKSTFLIGFSFFYAQFTENGTFQIKESFFGDYIDNFQRKNLKTGGLELNMSLWQPLSQRFAFVIGSRISAFQPIDLSGQPHEEFPIQYFPNIGLNLSKRGGKSIGLGFDAKIIYRIF
jgi:Domain of unknown function (DUF6048)